MNAVLLNTFPGLAERQAEAGDLFRNLIKVKDVQSIVSCPFRRLFFSTFLWMFAFCSSAHFDVATESAVCALLVAEKGFRQRRRTGSEKKRQEHAHNGIHVHLFSADR
jgi:hypothetical protein